MGHARHFGIPDVSEDPGVQHPLDLHHATSAPGLGVATPEKASCTVPARLSASAARRSVRGLRPNRSRSTYAARVDGPRVLQTASAASGRGRPAGAVARFGGLGNRQQARPATTMRHRAAALDLFHQREQVSDRTRSPGEDFLAVSSTRPGAPRPPSGGAVRGRGTSGRAPRRGPCWSRSRSSAARSRSVPGPGLGRGECTRPPPTLRRGA